jgi:hypothetical protein
MSGAICHLLPEPTEELLNWAAEVEKTAVSPFTRTQQLTRRLGGHWQADLNAVEVGFWVPEIGEQGLDPEQVFLEVFTPLDEIDFQADVQEVAWRRERVGLRVQGAYVWGVVAGMRPGQREQVGSFYWLVYWDGDGQEQIVRDPLAYSLPFGATSPAELYDMDGLQAERGDKAYFAKLDGKPGKDGIITQHAPANILQIHVSTASPEGTLAGLTHIYGRIAAKLEAGEPLTPAEQNYVGYDAIQLMPIEPTIEFEAGDLFWQIVDEAGESVTIRLTLPTMINWGYDVMTLGSPAVQCTLLGSKRPSEFVDFITTLHNFPEPIRLILDVVYGHTDNQTLPLMNHRFFAGSNMYGQNLQYRQPVVRAMLLEMQRRKNEFGVDSLRVDGAQDFKYWEEASQTLHYDDDYLQLMSDVVQEVAGRQYRPWMIFEDGRPWPQDDWELASTYREVTANQPDIYQWGPLTFAHNTPFLFTFWASKWWRIREIADLGERWITGCANHDTLRRGTQVDPQARINTYLGNSLPQIFKKAYDNPAARLFDYVMMPGIPMDFINATMRAPWSFIRNTDDQYGVKIVGEEARFLDWAVTDETYQNETHFQQLKALGFDTLAELRRFVQALDQVVQITDYDLDQMVAILQTLEPPLAGPALTVDGLKQMALAWMEDVHDYCNVSHWQDGVDATYKAYSLTVREFRRERPYLAHNLRPDEHFDYLHPTEGSVIFYGLRRAPDDSEQLLFVANMEGASCQLIPADLPIPNLPTDGWQVALVTPGVGITAVGWPLVLHDSEAVVFIRSS